MSRIVSGLPSQQQGMGVSGIVTLIILIVVGVKLGMAIIPAQISDYQLNSLLASEIKKANDNNETARQFMENVRRQLSINASYDTTPEEVFTFTSERTGALAIHKDYEVRNNFFANVYIVNHFKGDITAADAK